MLAITICVLDSISTISILFMMFSVLVAFTFVRSVDCFGAKPLTATALIDSGKWPSGSGWISYAMDRYVRTLKN